MIALFFPLGLLLAGLKPAQAPPPSQPFTLELTVETSVLNSGSVVGVRILLKNTSASPLNCNEALSGLNGEDPNFNFDVRDEMGREVPKRIYPHPELGVFSARLGCKLAPGETWPIGQGVGRIYDMARPGKYFIRVSRPVSFNDPKAGVVTSNTIIVTIVSPPFSLKVSTATNEFKAGEEIAMTIRLKNELTGDLTIGTSSPPVDHHYFYSCNCDTAKRPLVLSSFLETDSPPLIVLKPGESHDEHVMLTSACDLSQPGKYRIQVGRYDPTKPNAGDIRSNEITLTVTP